MAFLSTLPASISSPGTKSFSVERLLLGLAVLLLLVAPAQAEDTDVASDEIALAVGQQTWRVVEKDLDSHERWQATWTVRADGKSFDAQWKKDPGGEEGNLRNFARIKSISGNRIVIDRPGLGQYQGTLTPDRRRITGNITWCHCSWEVIIEGGAAVSGGTSTISPTWRVVEKDLGSQERWQATWTVRADGKSFDAHWKKDPGGEEGNLRNFARIKSISGNRIVIDRPGLGQYQGTIAPDRRRITGKTTWCRCSWEVQLAQALPAQLR